MFNGIKDSIKAKLYDFAYTPFMSSYLISWILFNHKYLLVYFSGSTFDNKFLYLDKCHIEFLFPLYFALIYVFIYPALALIFYYATLWYNKQSMTIKQRIEDETPITQEQARELKREHYSLADERDKTLDKLKEREKEHAEVLENALKPLQNEIEAHITAYNISSQLIDKLKAENESLKKAAEILPSITAERDKLKEKFDNMTYLNTSSDSEEETTFTQLPKEVVKQEDDKTKVLRYFYEGNYKTTTESTAIDQIISLIKLPRPKIKIIIDELINDRILNKENSYLKITDSGNRKLVELFDLTGK